MTTYTGTAADNAWDLIAPGTFTLDGLAGVDTLNLGTSLRSAYKITKAADGGVHIDSISGASALHATLYNMEILTFNSKADVVDLRTYFGTAVPPTVSITDTLVGTAIGNVTYNLAFSVAVTGLTASDFTVSNGSVVSVSGSGAGYSVVVALDGEAALQRLDMVVDASNNANAVATSAPLVAIDTRAPTVAITDNTPGTATGNVIYSLSFSEAVKGLAASGFTVSNGSVLSVTGSGASYSVTVTPAANTEGNMGLSLNAGAVTDLPGNAIAAATIAAAQPVDTKAPTVTITDNTAGTATGNVSYALAFSEAVSGLTAGGITVTNGSVVSVAGSGASYTVVVAPAANTEGSMGLSLNAHAVTDLPGNAIASAMAAAAQAIDTKPPTVSSYSPTVGATGIDVGSNLALSFSEPVALGSGTVLLKAADGSTVASYDAASSANLSVSGNTLTVNPSADLAYSTAYTLSLAPGTVKDLAGNSFAGTTGYTFSTIAAINHAPTGTVTIAGTALQGQPLTASHTLVDPDGLGTVHYQWLADGAAIDGATAGTLVLAEAQVGKVITAVASYVDGHGTAEAVASSPTVAVVNVNDPPSGAVTVTGTALQGQTLSASNKLSDADGLGTVHYQWNADGQAIAGATATTLVLAEAQVGKAITVVASYIDGHGTAETVSSSASVAVVNVNDPPTGVVTITGTALKGQALGVSNTLADADGLGTLHYQWDAEGAAIPGATGSTLLLGDALLGHSITVAASYTDGHGTPESVSSAALYVNTAPSGQVTLSGTPTVGSTLTAANTLSDADGLGPVHYQWLADGSAIAGATGSSLVLGSAQLAQAISVAASYLDGHGTAESVASGATMVQAASALNVAPAAQSVVSALSIMPTGAAVPTELALALNSNNAGTDALVLSQAGNATTPTALNATVGELKLAADLSAQGHGATGESFSLYVDKSLAVDGFWVQTAAGDWVNLASAPFGGDTVIEGNKIRLDFTVADGSVYDANTLADHLEVDGVVGNVPLTLLGHPADIPPGGFHF